MWRELIQSFDPAVTFLPAATTLQIEDVEAFLGVLQKIFSLAGSAESCPSDILAEYAV